MRVVLKNITKRFGSFVAVDNLNLSIQDGEFVALLGPSGCGKSTTLLMLAGIYKPDEGEIIFGNRDVTHDLPKDRNVGMCFQNYALYPHMTVAENIAFPLKLRKMPKELIQEKVSKIAHKFQLDSLLDRRPGEISGGQQQRVALARALVKEPEILLLDEPLSNLDSALRISMRAEIKRLQKELGITTVFVTHDQTEALSMCDRIAVMSKGTLQDFDTPTKLYSQPKNIFIAEFIGNPPMNFLDVIYVRDGDAAYLQGESFKIRLPERVKERFAPVSNGEKLVLGVRPENLRIGAEGNNALKGDIYVVEPLGRDKLVNVKIGDSKIKVIAAQDYSGNMGETVSINIDLDKIHLFSSEAGNSLRISA